MRHAERSSGPATGWRRWLPGLASAVDHKPGWVRADTVAGVTVAAYLVPQCMAYGELAGLSPVAGLWAAVVPLAVYAFVGSSRHLSVGPESTAAIMVATAIAPLAAGDPSRAAALAAGAALVTGLVCLAGAALRLGFLATLLSRPVLVGYLAGVAVIMLGGQLEKLTGVPTSADRAPQQIAEIAGGIGQVHLPTLALGLAVFAFLVAGSRWFGRWPVQLLAVIGSTAVVEVFDLTRYGIAVVGSVPAGLPPFGAPALQPGDLLGLTAAGLGIAVVAATDNIVIGRGFAARTGDPIDANQELLALGVANLGAGFSGGFTVSSSSSRTAVAVRAGNATALYGLVVCAAVVAVLLFASSLLASFPQAALGAIVAQAAVGLLEPRQFRRFARFRRSEALLAVAAATAVVLFDVLIGVAVAVALSIVDLFARVARPHAAVLGRVPGLAGLHDVTDYPQARTLPGLVVFRYDAPLCFANADDFVRRALAAVDDAEAPVRWLLLNAEAIVDIDSTAADAIEALRAGLAARGIVFALARAKQGLRAQLARSGVLARIGEDRLYPTLPTALDAFDAEEGPSPGAPGSRGA